MRRICLHLWEGIAEVAEIMLCVRLDCYGTCHRSAECHALLQTEHGSCSRPEACCCSVHVSRQSTCCSSSSGGPFTPDSPVHVNRKAAALLVNPEGARHALPTHLLCARPQVPATKATWMVVRAVQLLQPGHS